MQKDNKLPPFLRGKTFEDVIKAHRIRGLTQYEYNKNSMAYEMYIGQVCEYFKKTREEARTIENKVDTEMQSKKNGVEKI